MKQKYHAIYYFLSCYLNQDFDVIFGGFEEALEAYCRQESVIEQQALINDLQQIIRLAMSEQQLQTLVYTRFDCQFNYLLTFSDTTEWLHYILDYVSQRVTE